MTNETKRPSSSSVGSRSFHHCPRIMSTGRHGCWAECRCGWVSPTMTSRIGASHEWALHVRATLRKGSRLFDRPTAEDVERVTKASDEGRIPTRRMDTKGSQRATDQVECAKCGSTGPDGWCEWCKAPVTKGSRDYCELPDCGCSGDRHDM